VKKKIIVLLLCALTIFGLQPAVGATTNEAAPTLGPLFVGAGKLYTDSGFNNTLTSKQYSGAAEPDATNHVMYGEIGKQLWLGTIASVANTSNLGLFTISLSPTTSLNTAGCSIGATTAAGTYTSKTIAYAPLSATGSGSCVVYVTRATYVNTGNSTTYTTTDSIAWTVQWGTPCANITTANRASITCHIGQLGPGGGIVFYDAGDAGYATFQARYLEAPPSGWYGVDQPTNVSALYNGTNFFTSTQPLRGASAGDPIFYMCIPANTNLTGSTSRVGTSDTTPVTGSTGVGDIGPGLSLNYIDQSARFQSDIGSGPNNDRLFKNSMCAFTPNTPQYELAHWKSPTDSQYGLWSTPAQADLIPMFAHSYTLDMNPGGGGNAYMSSTPCWVDYRPGGAGYTSCIPNNATIFGGTYPNLTSLGGQYQMRTSPNVAYGSFLGSVPTWNTAGSMTTSTFPSVGSVLHNNLINYGNASNLLRPVRAFPFYSTDAKLSAASGLTVTGGVSNTNYALSPTYSNTVTSYTVTVTSTETSVKIVPQLSDFHATVTVNGVAGGDLLPTSVALTAGVTTPISVVITAISGDVQTYTINVTRPLASRTAAFTTTSYPSLSTGGTQQLAFTTSPSSNSDGTITYTPSNANCSVSATGLVTMLAVGSCVVSGTISQGSSYASATAPTSVTLTAAKGTPTITWSSPTIPFNANSGALSLNLAVANPTYSYTLPVTVSDGALTYALTTVGTPGTAGCSITGTTLSWTAAGTCSLKVSSASTANFNAATVSSTFTISLGTRTLTLDAPIPTALTYPNTATLTATASAGGGAITFAATGGGCSVGASTGLVTVTNYAQTCSIIASIAADSQYASASTSASVISLSAAIGITPTFSTPVVTTTGFTVNVTNYAVGTTFTPTITSGTVTAGTVSGSTLPLTVTGLTAGQTATITVTTTKANTTSPSATVAFHAAYTGPTVTAVLTSVSVGTTLAPSFTRTSLQGSDTISSVTYSYTGTGSTNYASSTTAPTAIGTYSITPSAAVFSPTSSAAGYGSLTYISASFSITALTRTISFTTVPTSLTYNLPATLLAAPTAGAGTITYTSSNNAICSISGSQVTAVAGSGTCTVTATIATDGTYAQATVTSATITLAAASRTLNFTSSPSTLAYGQSGTVVAAVGLGGGTVTYSAGSSTACSVGASTGVLTLTSGTGTCQISASITADSNYSSVSTLTPASITITLGTQATLTITSASTKGYANSYTLTTSGGTTAGAVTYAVTSSGNTANCSLTGAALTTTGAVATTCVITATMAANSNYTAVSSTGFTLTIVKSSQAALVITSSQSKPFSSALALTTSGGTGSGLISYAITTAGTAGCSIAGSAPTFSLITSGAIGTTCAVTATSAQTTNYLAISSAPVIFTVVANKPTPPLITSVSPGDSSVTVSWTAPSDFGGASQIDTYTVTSAPGGFTCTATTTSCTVAGLTNGTPYTFTVTAGTIGGGTSDPSTASSSITPVTKAAAVTGLIVTTGDGQLTINWNAVTTPALGGGTFTSYLLYYKAHSASTYGAASATITDQTITTSTITGLANGTAYDVKIVTLTSANATEIAGNAAEALQTPAAPASAPRALAAYSADGTSALVTWQVPLTDGGSAIDAYHVSVLMTSTSVTCTLATPTSTSCTLTSLTRGATLTISVKANTPLMGEGSAATLSYILPNVPNAPTWVSAIASPVTGNAGTVALTWVAPVNNGGRAVTSYFVQTLTALNNTVVDSQTVYAVSTSANVADVTAAYKYLVYAINEIGNGAYSDTLTVTTTLPGSVVFGSASSSAPNLLVDVSVPSDGGSPITGYQYSLDGITYITISSSTSPLTIPGLTPGQTYNLRVKSVNAIGVSAQATSILVVYVQGATVTNTVVQTVVQTVAVATPTPTPSPTPSATPTPSPTPSATPTPTPTVKPTPTPTPTPSPTPTPTPSPTPTVKPTPTPTPAPVETLKPISVYSFSFKSAVLKNGAALLSSITANTKSQITINGYADAKRSGGEDDLRLSLDRALTVKAALLKLHPTWTIKALGLGHKINPKCESMSNRCVEIIVKNK
jgi:outer membrane protein OmpA-like peptidoglycan-associated protein